MTKYTIATKEQIDQYLLEMHLQKARKVITDSLQYDWISATFRAYTEYNDEGGYYQSGNLEVLTADRDYIKMNDLYGEEAEGIFKGDIDEGYELSSKVADIIGLLRHFDDEVLTIKNEDSDFCLYVRETV